LLSGAFVATRVRSRGGASDTIGPPSDPVAARTGRDGYGSSYAPT